MQKFYSHSFKRHEINYSTSLLELAARALRANTESQGSFLILFKQLCPAVNLSSFILTLAHLNIRVVSRAFQMNVNLLLFEHQKKEIM